MKGREIAGKSIMKTGIDTEKCALAVIIRQFNQYQPIFFCGGGAKNPALKDAIEKDIGSKVVILPEPQFVPAYGAAITEK